jgi:hypothetical protein
MSRPAQRTIIAPAKIPPTTINRLKLSPIATAPLGGAVVEPEAAGAPVLPAVLPPLAGAVPVAMGNSVATSVGTDGNAVAAAPTPTSPP